jgi:hypothetical protein
VRNRERKHINIETPERNSTKQTRQYDITEYAEKNSLHPTTYPLRQIKKLTMPENNKSCHPIPSEPRIKISIHKKKAKTGRKTI